MYVGGGSVVRLMGVLRADGLDVALREAWEAGVVLCGLSAGSCAGSEAMTGYHGASRPVQGIGLIPLQRRALRQGAAPPARLPRRRRRRDAGRLRGGGRRGAALRRRVARARRLLAAGGARVRVDAVDGGVVELPLAVDYLGADAEPGARALAA